MFSHRFAAILFVTTLLSACNHDAAKPSEQPSSERLAFDSSLKRMRMAVRPALPPLTPSAAVLVPDTIALRTPAPDSFDIVFETSQGDMTVAVVRAWAPRGVDRLYYLAKHGFFDAMRFYKVQRDFIAQFGFNGDPRVSAVWDTMSIKDDPSTRPHTAGSLAFASSGPNTRTTHLFFSVRDNEGLEQSGLTVVGRVVKGVEVLPRLYDVYGQGLGEERILKEGNVYLERFTEMDYIVRATVKP